MSEVKLLGFWGSPYAKRVEIALKLKGLEYEYIEQDLINKSSLLLECNPVHKKVPVLLHNGKPIAESLVILEYLDEVFDSPSILPKDPYDKAMARFWVKFMDEKLFPTFLQTCRATTQEQRKKFKQESHEFLTFLDNELEGKRFFGGDTIGLVDIAGVLVAHWLVLLQEVLGLDSLTKDKFPNLCEWVDEFTNLSIVQEVLPPNDKLIKRFQALFRIVPK